MSFLTKTSIFLFLIVLAGTAGAFLVSVPAISPVSVGSFNVREFIEDIAAEPQKEDSIAFVGDILLGRNVERLQAAYGANYVYEGLPDLSTSTVLVGNFESAVAREHEPTPDFGMSFSSPSSTLSSLHNYGFKYVSLANNHSYDKGEANYLYTLQQLEIAGLVPFGDQKIASNTVTYVDLEDVRVALFGLYALDERPDMVALETILRSAEDESDFQIAYIHWGLEYEMTHSPFQQALAYDLVDMGFDSIIGHHSHTVQDIELYNGAYIFYSLGNFIFDQYFSQEVQEGLWVELSFAERKPVYTLKPVSALGSWSQPRFMPGRERAVFLRELAKRSQADLQERIIVGTLTTE